MNKKLMSETENKFTKVEIGEVAPAVNPSEYKYEVEKSSTTTHYFHLTETFDADKLGYIINNFTEFKHQLRWRARYDEIDPVKIITKYLERSRHGAVCVDYRQNRARGRHCAIGCMSLQCIPREIRHTISREFYYDIDMVNAHPVILSFLCHMFGFACPALDEYIANREELLKQIVNNDGKRVSRDSGKQIYLALTNGGNKDFSKLEQTTPHLLKYKAEMLQLHQHFAHKDPKEFEKVRTKRKKEGKDFNHKAGYMNTLLCDMENNLLMTMYDFFKRPKDAVLCFDGIMVRQGVKYDIDGCMEHLYKTFGIHMKIKQKTMDEHLDMSECVIPKYKYQSLEYYTDFRNLVKKKVVYPEWIEEWSNNSLILIEGDGRGFFLTRNPRVIVLGDKSTETRDEWKPVKLEDVEKSLKVKVSVINIFKDFEFSAKYRAMKPKDKKELNMDKSTIEKLTLQYIYGTLGVCSNRLGNGYLTHIMEEREIKSYNTTDFFPYLKSKGCPPLEDAFNIFTQFPMDSDEIKDAGSKFEDSLLYKHLQEDFFNGCKDEMNHFLDHIADILQDPAQIKGTSHLFYSPQGCGKGMLFKFMSKLLGISNVVSIVNTDTYFDKNFNSDVANKVLKVFEEVSEKGSAFKNHNRLKGEQTAENERVEPKGIDPYYNRHCARFWYFTNNENSLFIENDDRRHSLHRISPKHANNYKYFKPIWAEIKDEKFLTGAFKFFSTRKYDEKNVINAFTTTYKKEQKNANLPKGVKFILTFVESEFEKVEDKCIKISSNVLKNEYKQYCERQGTKYQVSAFNTQIKKIGIDPPKQVRVKGEDGESVKKFCYMLNLSKLQDDMRVFLRDDAYVLKVGDMVDEVNANELF
jgi:hypothetical protein